jgi:hypothetical protein
MLVKPNSKPCVPPRFLASVAAVHFVKAPRCWEYWDISPLRTNEFSLSRYSSPEWQREAASVPESRHLRTVL